MGAEKYRKKPVVIEAMQWTGDNAAEILKWAGDKLVLVSLDTFPASKHIQASTLEGDMFADVGDWIIKGVVGEFYPCKPDIFEMTYEAVKEGEE